jgi:type I restriction enzyme M protein
MFYQQPSLISPPLSQSEWEHLLWEAANILHGPVDAADFKTYIFPLLFYKRICDVYDEEYQQLLMESGHAMQKVLRKIAKANQRRLDGVFGDAQWANKELYESGVFIVSTLTCQQRQPSQLGDAVTCESQL